MKWLGLVLFGILSAVGLVSIIDFATMRGGSLLIGGSPVFVEGDHPSFMLSGRIVRFPPLLQQDRRRAAVLDEDYFFCERSTGTIVRLPRGYQTDFASIPDIARILVDRLGTSLEPAAIHDWLYSTGEGAGTPEQEQKRREADDIFLRALEDNDVGLATRTIMYLAVRFFGGPNYGAPQEWAGRLKNPITGENLREPPPLPAAGTLDTVDCGTFDEEINRLVGCYSTNEDLRFDAEAAAEAGCREGDGLTVSRSPTA